MCTVYGAMSFEVTQAHPPMLAQRALLCFGQAEVGQEVISVSMIGELHGEILAFRCKEKAAMVLKVSLQAITAWFSTVLSRLWREGVTFPYIVTPGRDQRAFRSPFGNLRGRPFAAIFLIQQSITVLNLNE